MFDLTSLNSIFLWFAVGTVALLIGFVGLLSRRSRAWFVPLFFAVLAAGGGIYTAIVETPYVAVPPALFSLSLLTLLAFRTSMPQRLASYFFRYAACPVVQSLTLFLLGVSLLTWQSWALTREVEQELYDSDQYFLVYSARPNLKQMDDLTLQTDGGKEIPVYLLPEEEGANAEQEQQYLSQRVFHTRLIQLEGPNARYNCHGWVFAGGKAWVLGSAVEQILKDNNYVVTSDPESGDIAVFRDQEGGVMHTAIVRGKSIDGVLLLESKWGKLGRYVHTQDNHAYRDHECTYYRTNRSNHVLQTVLAE